MLHIRENALCIIARGENEGMMTKKCDKNVNIEEKQAIYVLHIRVSAITELKN